MNFLFLFEARRMSKHWLTPLITFILTGFGIFRKILFKDLYSKFEITLLSLPFLKSIYSNGKFSNYFLLLLLSSSFLMVGFLVGQNHRINIIKEEKAQQHYNNEEEESSENLPSHKNTQNTSCVDHPKDSATMIKLSTLIGGF